MEEDINIYPREVMNRLEEEGIASVEITLRLGDEGFYVANVIGIQYKD